MSLQVSLKFSSPQELPAEKTTLSLKAHPGSVCSVRAVDQSVLLLQAEEELSVASVTVPSVSHAANPGTPPEPGRLLPRSSSSCPTRSCPATPTRWRTRSRTPASPGPCGAPWKGCWWRRGTASLAPSAPSSTHNQTRRTTSTASLRFRPLPVPLPETTPNVHLKNDFFFSHQEIGMKFVTNGDVKKPYDCLERFPIYAFYDGRSRTCTGPVRIRYHPPDVPVLPQQTWWMLRFPWPSTPWWREGRC